MAKKNVINQNGTINIKRTQIEKIGQKTYIHFEDESYRELDDEIIKHLITSLSYISKIKGDIAPGTDEQYYLSISRPKILAFFVHNDKTNTYSIVLMDDFKIVNDFIRFDESKDYLSVKEFAKIHNKSPQRIRDLCVRGILIGAYKDGRDWKIPRFSEYPKWGYGK